MGHTERTGAATVRFTMHVDGSLDRRADQHQVGQNSTISSGKTELPAGAAAETQPGLRQRKRGRRAEIGAASNAAGGNPEEASGQQGSSIHFSAGVKRGQPHR